MNEDKINIDNLLNAKETVIREIDNLLIEVSHTLAKNKAGDLHSKTLEKEKNKDIGILLTSHPGHRIFLKESMYYWSQMAERYEIVMGWDDEYFLWHHSLPANIRLFTTGKKLGLTDGEWKQFEIGIEILRSIFSPKYIFKASPDFIIKDWYRVPELIDYMEGNDYLCSEAQPDDIAVGTHIFFAHTDKVQNAVMSEAAKDSLKDHTDRRRGRTGGVCEMQMSDALNSLGYSFKMQSWKWWQEKIGFVDLQMGWTKKTGLGYGLSWEEGSKFYDVSELNIFGKHIYNTDKSDDIY